MGKTKVWIISKYATPTKYPRHFGIGKDLVAKGLNVTLIASVSNSVAPGDVPKFKGWSKVENHNGLKVIWMNGPSITNAGIIRIFSWFWFEFKVLMTMLFKSKPDAIISSSLSLLSVWSGYFLSRRFKSRFIFEVRDIWPLSLIELGGYSESNILIRFLRYTELLGYRKADAIIGTMPNLKGHVQNVCPEAAEKVVCVPQGVYLEIFEEQSQKLSAEYLDKYIPKNKFIIAYTGTLNPNNPIDTLFEVAKRFETDYPQIHFLILGEGKNKDKYMSETAALSNVSFPPTISKNQMAHFLSFVDVGYDAFSSTLAEFGLSRNKWIDYMYNSCIIICSYDGFQSMINESQSGLFVPYQNEEALYKGISQIYNMTESERANMGARARAFIAENRTFEKLGDKYLALISG